MTYDIATPSIARLWPYHPDWASGFEIRRAFLTDITTSRNNTERRRALRDVPRLTASFAAVVVGDELQGAKHYLRAWQNKPAALPDFSRYATLLNSISGGASSLDIANAPGWLAPGQLIYLCDSSQSELIEVEALKSRAICFALDNSSSMIGARLTTLKAAMASVLELIRTRIESGVLIDLSVVTFGDTSQSITRRSADSTGVDDVLAFVNAMAGDADDTDFRAGMDGAKTFFDATDVGVTDRFLFFITDGLPTDGGGDSAATITSAAAATLATMSGVDSYAINIVLTDTTYTAQLDNTASDGVPIVSGSDATGLTDAVTNALFASETMTLADPVSNAWAAGSIIRPALFGLLDGRMRSARFTRGSARFDVRFAVYPGIEPPEFEGVPTDTFNGYEVFTVEPNFAGQPSLDHLWPVEQIDFGIGRTAQFRPIDRQEQMVECEFSGLTPATAQAIEQVFLRAKGMRGAFYRPTGEKDITLAADTSAVAYLDAVGTDLFDDFGSIDYAENDVAIEIVQTNGTRTRKLITGITASGGNSRIAFSGALTLTVATVARISWMPLVRFASDELATSWRGPAAGTIRTTFETVKQ
jgi:uncharacterized protein YegL